MLAVPSWLARPASFLGSKIRSRKAATAIVLLIVGVCAGVYSFGLYQFHAAEDAAQQFHLEQARQHLNRCLLAWPKSHRAILLAARVCRMQGQLAEAQAYLTTCQRIAGMTEELEL